MDIKHIDSDLNPIAALQTFLVNIGILRPEAEEVDGFFAYRTLAGVRLFQEYVRIYDPKPGFWPDGVVGKGTWAKIREWQAAGKKADNWARGAKSQDYLSCLGYLNNARQFYQDNPNYITTAIDNRLDELNKGGSKPVDTFKTKDWSFNADDVHLIGIRRKEQTTNTDGRKNDDVFILLVDGKVFLFGGSTDPGNKFGKTRSDEAYLTEGQHKFKFGWHKHSNRNKSYMGLNPYGRGVLIYRDKTGKNKLTQENVVESVGDNKQNPNTTINIHWTGHVGNLTWSEGCQVLFGTKYIDNQRQLRDLTKFAAPGNPAFATNRVKGSISLSKAAYNVFTDLVLLYGPKREKPEDYYLLYTLGREDIFDEEFLQDLGLKELLSLTIDGLGLP